MLQQIRRLFIASCAGFTLIEAMMATAIASVGFVGTYTLVATSEVVTTRSIGRQKIQMIADQMLDIIDTDVSNIDSYAMTLTTCTDPGSGASQALTRGYEWCTRITNEIGAAVTGETRSITISTLSSGNKVAHIVIDGYNNKIQVVMKREFNI